MGVEVGYCTRCDGIQTELSARNGEVTGTVEKMLPRIPVTFLACLVLKVMRESFTLAIRHDLFAGLPLPSTMLI